MSSEPLSKMSADDKRWAIESAAGTLKAFFRIKKDKPLLKAAREYLKEEIANAKSAMKV